jgi:hypothetical protein
MVRVFRNFQEAHAHYKYPATHRTGSIANEYGVIRSYSNGAPLPGSSEPKDIIAPDHKTVFYRLKSAEYRHKFERNVKSGQRVRVFRKITEAVCSKAGSGNGKPVRKGTRKISKVKVDGVMDLGLFTVAGFTKTHVKLMKE